MTTAHDLISKGFFPKEAQPTFVSTTFANCTTSLGNATLDGFISGIWWTRAARHNLARPDGLRRQLCVPNPLAYQYIARKIEAAWTPYLQPIIAGGKWSASRLTTNSEKRAVQASQSGDALELIRAKVRTGCRFLIQADVQNFYASIYTHAIDWAIHGKDVAKAAIASKTYAIGQDVDKAFRGSQEGQTIGIPIGPDASLIVAECLMARVENSVESKLGGRLGYRYWDDFEIAFQTHGEAEAGLWALQESLSEFELSLNPRKTRIVELPEAQIERGLFEIGQWDFLSGPKQRHRLIAYFDHVFRHVVEDRGTYVAAFAVARLRSLPFNATNWPLIQSNILQLLVTEPTCARYVAEMIGRASDAKLTIDKDAIAAAAEALAIRHAPLSHGSEVAWAIWICIAHSVSLSEAAAKSIGAMTDNFVALLALHARSVGLMPTTFDTSLWESLITTLELRSSNWLLSYEASIKDWLPAFGGGDHIASDPWFSVLRANHVEFYDVARLKLTTLAAAPSATGAIKSLA